MQSEKGSRLCTMSFKLGYYSIIFCLGELLQCAVDYCIMDNSRVIQINSNLISVLSYLKLLNNNVINRTYL